MGNKSSHTSRKDHNESGDSDSNDQESKDFSTVTGLSKRQSRKVHIPALITLFEKLELTADEGNAHPGELSKATFENAFHGPLHIFGKLMFLQMVRDGVGVSTIRERITREQFVKAGTEILQMFEEKQLVKYYFHLFASGKDYLTPDDAKQMFEIAFTLTLSLSQILYKDDERDVRLLKAMATGLFGIETEMRLEKFGKWLQKSCPHMFHCVHNWVCNVMTGSTLPEEVEMARVPQLDGFVSGNNSVSMAILWLLSITLPAIFTKQKELPKASGSSDGAMKHSLATTDPLLTAMILLRKNARLPQVQSWKPLYNSDNHGMSINRFNHHVSSYSAPTVTFFSFEGRNLYCLAVDTGWREGPSKFGGDDCMLIQVLPVYRVVQAGATMVRWCENTRGIPSGIQVGCDGMSEVLKVPKEFDQIFHYGVPCGLHRVEVWGCGNEDAFDSQVKQRKWEAAAVQKERSRKLRPYGGGETWDDTPDKQILQWGGVNVGNSYNR